MKEIDHANGNESGPLLSEVEGQAGQVQRRRNLPKQYPAVVAHGKTALEETPRTRVRLRRVDDKFLADYQKRAENFRLDGLIELHRLAMMPLGEPRDNATKMQAAAKLVELRLGGNEVSGSGLDLTSLQEAYRNQAVRIRQVREKTVTYVDSEVIDHDADVARGPTIPV